MKCNYLGLALPGLLLLSALLCSSCVKRIYRQGDFRLYERNYHLSSQELLRTDGVYVLDSIHSNEGSRVVTDHQFYTFFKSGQVNLTLDLQYQIRNSEDYYQAVLTHLQKTQDPKMNTLFEGYFKIDSNLLVIERASVPRNILVYHYAMLKPDGLGIVKTTINGKGKIKEKNFMSNYREAYRFVPIPQLKAISLTPGW